MKGVIRKAEFTDDLGKRLVFCSPHPSLASYRSNTVRSNQQVDIVDRTILKRDANSVVWEIFYPNELHCHMHVSLVYVLQQRSLELGPDKATTLAIRGYASLVIALD
jgi:hypothetical protein